MTKLQITPFLNESFTLDVNRFIEDLRVDRYPQFMHYPWPIDIEALGF